MTKQELIDQIYKKRGAPAGLTKKAVNEIIDGVFAELGDYFVRNKVTKSATPKFTYPGFGTFSKKRRPARDGRHPQTGQPIKIPSSCTVSFAAGRDLKTAMNGG